MHTSEEKGNRIHPRAAVITVIVLAAALLRIAPHPVNFTPIGALALFGGAYFSSKRAAYIVPLLSLFAGDIFTGFHPLMPYVYASFLVSVSIGFWLRREKSGTGFSLWGFAGATTEFRRLKPAPRWPTASRIGAATLAGSIQFFLITNFSLWGSSIGNYPKDAGGLAACYVAGLPLFWNTLASDAFYVVLLFGAMALAETRFPRLRESYTAPSGTNLVFD